MCLSLWGLKSLRWFIPFGFNRIFIKAQSFVPGTTHLPNFYLQMPKIFDRPQKQNPKKNTGISQYKSMVRSTNMEKTSTKYNTIVMEYVHIKIGNIMEYE